MPPVAIVAGVAIAGAVAGSQSSKSSSEYKNSSGVDAGNATGAEKKGQQGLMSSYDDLQNFVKGGPGQSDVSNAYSSTKGLASMYGDYSKSGGLPNEQDISNSNQVASNLFAPQQTALNQSFLQQGYDANRQAALMGRSIDDPILAAKLRVGQTQQTQMLNANQGAFAQQMALQQPYQRLGFAQQQTSTLQGLATQAMQNRQALASMGEGIMNNERNFRLQTATRYGNGTQSTESGGGFKGALEGGMAGLGAGMGIAAGMPSMSGGSTPSTQFGGAYGGGMGGYQGGFTPMPTLSMSGPLSGVPSIPGGSTPFSGGRY